MNEQEIATAVAAGAAWLDTELGPDWINDIDLDRLNMASAEACILGQLWNGYWNAPPMVERSERSERWGVVHGFIARLAMSPLSTLNVLPPVERARGVAAQYASLGREWVRVITERRAGGDAAALASV